MFTDSWTQPLPFLRLNDRNNGKTTYNQLFFTHINSRHLAFDATDGITPFLLMFGRNATLPKTGVLQLSSESISKNAYAKYQ